MRITFPLLLVAIASTGNLVAEEQDSSPIKLPTDFFAARESMLQVFISSWSDWAVYGTAPEANADRSLSSSPGDTKEKFIAALGEKAIGNEACVYFTGTDEVVLNEVVQSLLHIGYGVVQRYRFDKEKRALIGLGDIKDGKK